MQMSSPTEVRFARTRYEYSPYVDFWDLVTLSGFRVDYVDEMELYNPDVLYIVSPMNGEWRPHIDNHRDRTCKLVHWLLERPDSFVSDPFSEYRSANQGLIDKGYVDFNIVSDPHLAKFTGFHYVPMGSHEDLGMPGDEAHYDFIGLMSYTPRRAFLFYDPNRVATRIDGLTFAPNADAIKATNRREILLQESCFGINVHKDEFPFCEPIRFALFAAYGLCILSESIIGDEFYLGGVTSIPHSGILDQAQMMKAYADHWLPWGAWLRERLTGEFSFRRCLERWL
jgi:hypothetical protein